MSWYEGKFRLDFRKTFLVIETLKHCNRFSGEDMDLRSWKTLRTDDTKISEMDTTEVDPAMAQEKLDDHLNFL